MSGVFQVITKVLLASGLLLAGAMAAPAMAQNASDGHKFLQAVDKKEGGVVNDLLGQAGSTVINSRDLSTRRTALHIVVERRDATWVQFLLSKGADPNLADNRGITPLLLAGRIGFHAGVEALVKGGARVDEPNSAGETPLIFAVHQRDKELMRTLLKAGADPDRSDSSGRSARDYAQLDGAQSALVTEIDQNARSTAQRRASAQVYGPAVR